MREKKAQGTHTPAGEGASIFSGGHSHPAGHRPPSRARVPFCPSSLPVLAKLPRKRESPSFPPLDPQGGCPCLGKWWAATLGPPSSLYRQWALRRTPQEAFVTSQIGPSPHPPRTYLKDSEKGTT